jgi:nucleotide-binding universal stress UspA family protein
MRTITRILCPVDLSDTSRLAAQHALLLASWYQAAVTVVHVANPIVVPATDWSRASVDMSAILTDEERRDLRDRVDGWVKAAGLDSADVVVEHGTPANRILALARALPADVIVMGTHGTSGFEHLVLGSVAEKVLRQSCCPVLTVPPRARTTSALPYQRILCPVDFSDPSRAALDVAASLAHDGRAQLTVLYALEWPSEEFGPFTPGYRLEVEQSAAARLREMVPSVAGCPPRIQVAPGKAYREILDAAAAEGADLIVMGVHGRNALDMMLFGSTTNQVVRRATCPVLTLRE